MMNAKKAIPDCDMERTRCVGTEPIMIIHVEIDRNNCPEMTMLRGRVKLVLKRVTVYRSPDDKLEVNIYPSLPK